MERGEKKLILYFYLPKKLKNIEKTNRNNKSRQGEKLSNTLVYFLKKAGLAALVTLAIYEIFFYLNMDRLLFWEELKDEFVLIMEIILAFFYILAIFLIFPKISSFLDQKGIKGYMGIPRTAMEVILILFINAFILSFVNYLPLFLTFPEMDPRPSSLRTGYLITSVFALFFYFFVERERSKKRLQEEMLRSARLQKVNFEAQLETLKQQVNPHFLFNSLNVLGSLIVQDGNRATQFTRKLSELYRSFLKYGDQQLISLQKELEVAESYIYLLETRFGNSVKFNLDFNPEHLQHKIPPGALQLLIENTIKHNGSTRKNPLIVEIYSAEDGIIVKNNLQPRLEKLESTGTGLKNIKSRYKYLSNRNIIIEKTDKEFIASIPLINENDENSNN